MKLNLGSGANNAPGYINIDQYANFGPDIVWDLEVTPYPFAEADSVDEIRIHHVLEHLGKETDVFFAIIQEFYRILKPGGLLDIRVPPGHGEQFSADPTHVRPIYQQTMALFSKAECKIWREGHFANTPLADYLDVDFEQVSCEMMLSAPWLAKYQAGELTLQELDFAVRTYNGVYREVHIICRKVARPVEKTVPL